MSENKTFRALLIDPEKRTIEGITYSKDQKISDIIGTGTLSFFAIADFGDTWDQGVVDDTGLTGGPVYAFRFDNHNDPLAGKCLIIGVDRQDIDGGTCDAQMPLGFVQEHVEWLGLIQPRVEWVSTATGHEAKVSYKVLES